ncbi:MAG: glycosyltransferase [Elusimicrobiaceae bacterium]|nr:glycosyltransferase [Elusimicrobiaceae bacterium]
MKILYLITSTTRGGAENTLRSLLARLDRGSFEPARVISLKPPGPVADSIRALGVPVQSLDMGYFPAPGDFAAVREAIRATRPDIVHAFLYRAIQFARAAKTPDFKLIASPRVNYRTRSPLIRLYDRMTCAKDDLVISESDSSREFLITGQGYNSAKVITIRNGVDSEFWQPGEPERAEARFRADIKDGELLLFSSGRLDTQKGYEYLLTALARIRRKTPRLKTVIAGAGPLEKRLFKLIAALELDGCVRLAGEQQHIRPWLNAADIFALPSLWEGVPNSLLEAMSMGRPCLASGVDGVLEAARPNAEILVARPADPQDLADKLLALYNDAPLRARLGQAAAEAARQRLAMPAMIAAYETAYRNILNPDKRESL